MQYNFYRIFCLLLPLTCILLICNDIHNNFENMNYIKQYKNDLLAFDTAIVYGETSNCTYINRTLNICRGVNKCANNMCNTYNNPEVDKVMLRILSCNNYIDNNTGIFKDHKFGPLYIFSIICLILIVIYCIFSTLYLLPISLKYNNIENSKFPFQSLIELLLIIVSIWHLVILCQTEIALNIIINIIPYFAIISFILYDIIIRYKNCKTYETIV